MTRFALIIEASKVPGEDPLPGAEFDAINYRNWLMSPWGGDWKDKEISVLHTPTTIEVGLEIMLTLKVDYAFVAFSGHGYHDGSLNETKLCLRDGELGVRSILPEADRTTVVIDACRKVMYQPFTESVELGHKVAHPLKLARRDFRKEFDARVMAAEKGDIFIYSCDLDEGAGEDEHIGGYFSNALVNVGMRYGKTNPSTGSWLGVDMAFSTASAITLRQNRQQHAKIVAGRRRAYFPFAV